ARNLRKTRDLARFARLGGVRPKAVVSALGLRRGHDLVDDLHDRGRVAMRMVAAEQIAFERLRDERLRRPEHLRLGATETVDALFGIADDEDAGPGAARSRIAAE